MLIHVRYEPFLSAALPAQPGRGVRRTEATERPDCDVSKRVYLCKGAEEQTDQELCIQDQHSAGS